MTNSVPKALNLKDFLPYRLSIVTNKVSSNLAGMYSEKFGLSISEWRVMAVLGQQSDLSADEVCSETEMDKVTVSRAVTKLLDKKYIERCFSNEDRRRSMLSLSKSGFAVYSQIAPMAIAYEKQLLKNLSKQEQESLNMLLEKLEQQAMDLSTADGN